MVSVMPNASLWDMALLYIATEPSLFTSQSPAAIPADVEMLPFLQILAHPLLCLAAQARTGMHSGEGALCSACIPPGAGSISPEPHCCPLCC